MRTLKFLTSKNFCIQKSLPTPKKTVIFEAQNAMQTTIKHWKSGKKKKTDAKKSLWFYGWYSCAQPSLLLFSQEFYGRFRGRNHDHSLIFFFSTEKKYFKKKNFWLEFVRNKNWNKNQLVYKHWKEESMYFSTYFNCLKLFLFLPRITGILCKQTG